MDGISLIAAELQQSVPRRPQTTSAGKVVMNNFDEVAGPFVCVGIDLETEKCVGVDFCKSEEELRWKADMFRRDFGDGYLIIEHPSRETAVVDGFAALAVEATTRSAMDAGLLALKRL